ncbi:hypothetical protein TNCV_2169751 [Trichonephila clavipes]|nr:hypothetical protein TNCV_2169751 [Trichonephila clavipes]
MSRSGGQSEARLPVFKSPNNYVSITICLVFFCQMCGMELGEMALKQVGDKLSEECKEEMEKKKEEMMGKEK